MSRSFMLLISSGAVLLLGLVLLTFLGGSRVSTKTPMGGTAGAPALTPSGAPPIGTVAGFTLTNQAGAQVTRDSLLGKPWAANLIFTRCPGPCTQLSGVMKDVSRALPADSKARLVSLTSDPEFDEPKILGIYGNRFGAAAGRWDFLTGTKGEIRKLATEGLKLVLKEKSAAERESEEDLFLHSTLIVMVDGSGGVRGVVEGLAPDAARRVVEGLRALEREK